MKDVRKCPDCGHELTRSYHIGFRAPIWLVCNNCKKEIERTEETGSIPISDSRAMLR